MGQVRQKQEDRKVQAERDAWVLDQYHLGRTPHETSVLYREAFGLDRSVDAVRKLLRRHGLKPCERPGRASPLAPVAGPEAEAGGRRHGVATLADVRQERIVASLRAQASAERHWVQLQRIGQDAAQAWADVVERWRTLHGEATPQQLQALATSLQRIASLNVDAIVQERRVLGLDQEDARSPVRAPVTAIKVVINGTPGAQVVDVQEDAKDGVFETVEQAE